MKPFATIAGLGVSLIFALPFITAIAPQLGFDPYTANEFQNMLLLLVIIEMGVICAEAVADSTAREVGIDTILAIAVSYIVNKIYFNQGIILFSGQWLLTDLIKKLFIPVLIVTGFAGLSGASGITKLINNRKLRKVG